MPCSIGLEVCYDGVSHDVEVSISFLQSFTTSNIDVPNYLKPSDQQTPGPPVTSEGGRRQRIISLWKLWMLRETSIFSTVRLFITVQLFSLPIFKCALFIMHNNMWIDFHKSIIKSPFAVLTGSCLKCVFDCCDVRPRDMFSISVMFLSFNNWPWLLTWSLNGLWPVK